MNESNISIANVSNISSANIHCKQDGPESDIEKIAKSTALVLLFAIGISLNIFVIILAAKYTIRKNLHYLIINMAVSDALFLLTWLLLYNEWSIYPSGTLGTVICKAIVFLLNTSFVVSLINLLMISIERFNATRKTLQRSRRYTVRQRVIILGVSWLIPMPGATYFAYAAKNLRDGRRCDFTEFSSPIIFSILASSYIILCCITVFLSILTTKRLSKPQAIAANLSKEQQNMRKRRTVAAIRMVLASSLLFPLCLLPSLAVLNGGLGWPKTRFTSLFDSCINKRLLHLTIVAFLPAVNSLFSPIVYMIFLSEFREATKKVLCRRNTPNQVPNRRNSKELQPLPNTNRIHTDENPKI